MQNELLIAVGAFSTLSLIIGIQFLILKKRNKKLNEQASLLAVRDNAAEEYAKLETTFQEYKNEAKLKEENLASTISGLEHKLQLKEQHLQQVAQRFINDHVDFLAAQITASNYVELKNKLEEIFDFCTAHDYEDQDGLKVAQKALRQKFEGIVRKDLERQSQEELKGQMREERTFQEKVKSELERLQQEKIQLQRDLQNAIHEANEKQAQQVQLKLNRVEEHIERANRQSSSSTTSGFVYILSNYGSLGEGVFKIGMTQSDTPEEEIKKLSKEGATPFPYDTHALINSADAQKLFDHLKQRLQKFSVNKVNLEQNFYALPLDQIIMVCKEIEEKVNFQEEPEALEYFQSMETSVEDLEYITSLKRNQSEE